MRSHKTFDFRTAYIDVLLNVLTGIIFLFVLTTLMIQPKKADEGMKKNAEYVLTAEWPADVDCDVDMWVRDPFGNRVWFEQKDVGIMHLERDDLGFRNDSIIDNYGNRVYFVNENKETWVLRGIMEGEFTVNLHLYSCRVGSTQMNLYSDMKVEVAMTLMKMNPKYSTLHKKTVRLQNIWEEVTAFNFTLDSQGNMTKTDEDQKRLIKYKQ